MLDENAIPKCKWCYREIVTRNANTFSIIVLTAWRFGYCSPHHAQKDTARAIDEGTLWWQKDLQASRK